MDGAAAEIFWDWGGGEGGQKGVGELVLKKVTSTISITQNAPFS